MADTRYNRWQGRAIAQLSIAVALISGLSVAGIGAGLSLLQQKEFLPYGAFKSIFAWSFVFLLLAAILSCSAVITRLLDFRLTARKVWKEQKKDYNRSLTILWLGPDAYGRATWCLFWLSCAFFVIGIAFLFVSVGATYADRLL